MPIKAILTDIEGTTSAVSFVFDVLFPYAAKHLPDFVRQHATRADVAEQLAAVRRDNNEPDADVERIIEILLGWIAEDRKATPLKALQGMVWEQGYQAGQLKGHVYPDAVEALKRWHQEGFKLFVYSSGSIQAQKLIFGCSEAGICRRCSATISTPRRGPSVKRSLISALLRRLALKRRRFCFCPISSKSWMRRARRVWRPAGWRERAGSWQGM